MTPEQASRHTSWFSTGVVIGAVLGIFAAIPLVAVILRVFAG